MVAAGAPAGEMVVVGAPAGEMVTVVVITMKEGPSAKVVAGLSLLTRMQTKEASPAGKAQSTSIGGPKAACTLAASRASYLAFYPFEGGGSGEPAVPALRARGRGAEPADLSDDVESSCLVAPTIQCPWLTLNPKP